MGLIRDAIQYYEYFNGAKYIAGDHLGKFV
jgi:hypothetical protein